MAVLIRLTEYLDELKEQEAAKEGIRLQVPTLTDLSADVGVHYVTMNRIAKNRVIKLDITTVDKVIKTMRSRGFDMDLTDFMIFEEDA